MKKVMFFLFALSLIINAQTRLRFITYGSESSPKEGDYNHVQSIHFELPPNYAGPAYVRIFDAACGSELDERYGVWDSKFSFSLYKGEILVDSLINNDKYILSIQNQLIKKITVGQEQEYLNRWALLAGISKDSGSIYTLVVKGLEGNDGNVFELFISSESKENKTIDNVKFYSYEPTIPVRDYPKKISFKMMPASSDDEIHLHTWDFDGTKIELSTFLRDGIPLKENNPEGWSSIEVPLNKYEIENFCAMDFGPEMHKLNDITFYFTDKQGKKLPVQMPFFNKIPATIPDVIKKIKQIDCSSAEIDLSGSNSKANNGLIYKWPGEAERNCRGEICTRSFPQPGKYTGEVLVEEQSNAITRAKLEKYDVEIQPKPEANAGSDMVKALNEPVLFDGSKSIVNDKLHTKYNWSFGDGTEGTGMKIFHTYNKPGKYNVVLAVEEPNKQVCCTNTAGILVTINLQPVAKTDERLTAPPNQALKFDASKSYDPDGQIVKYTWDFGKLGIKEGRVVEQSFSQTGSYKIKLTVQDNTEASNNSASAWVNVIIHNKPIPSPGKDRIVAENEEVIFDGSKSSSEYYKVKEFDWDFGDGNKESGAIVKHRYNKYGKYIVSLKVRDNSETVTDTNIDSISVIVNARPIAKIINEKYLNDGYAFFDASKSYDVDGYITKYNWDFGDGTKGEGKSVPHTYKTPGSYQVVLKVVDNTGTLNNFSYDTSEVIIDKRPIADIGPDYLIAPNQKVKFTNSRSIAPGGKIAKTRWFVDNKFLSDDSVFEYLFTNPGTYTVGLEVTDDFVKPLTSTDYAEVKVNSAPVPKIVYTQNVIPYQKIKFNASKSYDIDGAITSYSWLFSDGETKTGKIVEKSFAKSGLYSAILTIEDDAEVANSIASDTVFIKVNTQPVIKTDEYIESCDKIITLDASKSFDPDGDQLTYTWDFPNQKGVKASGIISHNFKTYGVFPVILTIDDGLNLPNSIMKKNITVKIHHPPVADAGADTTVCAGDIVIFSGLKSKSFDNTLLDYLWIFDDSTRLSGSSVFKVFKKGGLHKITLLVNDNSGLPCNSGFAEKLLNVVEAPIANAGNDTLICANTQIKFDGSKSTAADGVVNSYYWDFGDGETGDGVRPVHTYDKPGKYKVTLTISGNVRGNCANTSLGTMTITVVEAPLASFASKDSVAENSVQIFDASLSSASSGKITSYTWDFGDGSSASGSIVKHKYSKFGNYIASLIIQTDSKTECSSAFSSKPVNVNASPVAKIEPVKSGAVYQPISFNGIKSFDPDGNISNYQWDFGDASKGEGVEVLHSYKSKGIYTVILTVYDNTLIENNANKDTLNIIIYDEPAVNFSLPEDIFINHQVELNGTTSVNPAGESTYEWFINDVKISDEAVYNTKFEQAGLYKVRLVVKDKSNKFYSTGESTKYIKVVDYPTCSLPPSIYVCPGEAFSIKPVIHSEISNPDFKFRWYEKNGSFSYDGKELNHSIRNFGKYTFYFSISDGNGLIYRTDSTIIFVDAPPQIPDLKDSIVYINSANDEVKFDASNVFDPDGNNLLIHWNFGDGEDSDLPVVLHKYKKAGIYKVELSADDQTNTGCGKVKKSFNLTVKNRE